MVVNCHPFERIQTLKEYDQFTCSVPLRRGRFRMPSLDEKYIGNSPFNNNDTGVPLGQLLALSSQK